MYTFVMKTYAVSFIALRGYNSFKDKSFSAAAAAEKCVRAAER